MTEEKKTQELSQAERDVQAMVARSQARLDAVLAEAMANGEIVRPTPLTLARAEILEARLLENRKKRRSANAAAAAVVNAVSAAAAGAAPAAAPQGEPSQEPQAEQVAQQVESGESLPAEAGQEQGAPQANPLLPAGFLSRGKRERARIEAEGFDFDFFKPIGSSDDSAD